MYKNITSDPVPKLSSPHNDSLLASIRLPKNFQPKEKKFFKYNEFKRFDLINLWF